MKSYQHILPWNLISLSLFAAAAQTFSKVSQMIKKNLTARFSFSTPENLLESLSSQNVHLITLDRKQIKAVMRPENTVNAPLLFSSCVILKRAVGYSVELTADRQTWHNSHYSTRTAVRWLESLTGSLFIPVLSPVFRTPAEKQVKHSQADSTITLQFSLCFFRSY